MTMMSNYETDRLDKILKTIEFPGEDEVEITEWLSTSQFTDLVMSEIFMIQKRARVKAGWGLFAVAQIFILILSVSDLPAFLIIQELHKTLSQLFYLFLSLTVIGSITGFLLSLDTRWFDRMYERSFSLFDKTGNARTRR